MSLLNCIKEYLSDPLLIFLVLLLVVVLIVSFKGILSYPVGWLVLTMLIYLRIIHIRKRKRKQ